MPEGLSGTGKSAAAAAALPVVGSPKHPAALSPQANASVDLELGSDETPQNTWRGTVVTVLEVR